MAPGGSGQTGHPAPLGRTGVLAVRIAPVVPTDAPDVPPVVTLAVIWAELAEIRRLLEFVYVNKRRPPLSREDRDQLARMLPAIVGAWGSEPFASRELATDAGVRVVLRGLSIKQVGKLLARGAGIPIDGLMVERAGHEINVCLWRVMAC